MPTWTELFQPVVKKAESDGRTLVPRIEQELLGQGIIDAFETKRSLVAEAKTGTGKSFAALVPIIDAIKKSPGTRAVISTETIALQNQYITKDLPFLHSVYGGFKYCVLKGRSNYFCTDHAKLSSQANQKIAGIVSRILPILDSLGNGEKGDVERRLKTTFDAHTWSMISGSTYFCNDNDCGPQTCFAMRARAKALDSDIVVANHAILQVDTEMRDGQFDSDGLLGQFEYLIVDEAHTLESVLIDSWTESISGWELQELGGAVSKGFDKATGVKQAPITMGYDVQEALDGLDFVLDSTRQFYEAINPHEDWKRVSTALCEKRVYGTPEPRVSVAMENFEVEAPKRLARVLRVLADVQGYLRGAAEIMEEQNIKGRRPVKKGARAAKQLQVFCETVQKSMKTRDGFVMLYGVPHVIVVDGYEKRDGSHGIRIRTVPLDVSARAAVIWAGHTNVLLSATMTDPTDGTFHYAAQSLGFPDHADLQTGSPFDYAKQQKVYITPANQPTVEELAHAQYSFEEMVELINAASGRSLVLFTAKSELEDCAEKLLRLRAMGEFTWPVLIQDKDSDKQKLVEEFRDNPHSVLVGSKSFFTGVDFPGDTCSLVIICKFPLPRFDEVCRQQIKWWATRGFPRWYEREALQVFLQASGRLIRTGDDRGVIAVLDQRVTRSDERVYHTARIGVEALGSEVIRGTEDVRQFLL